jgi:hypothetical protein
MCVVGARPLGTPQRFASLVVVRSLGLRSRQTHLADVPGRRTAHKALLDGERGGDVGELAVKKIKARARQQAKSGT